MTGLRASRPNNLPIPLTSFVGRTREIAEVKRLLARTRLLTLTGAGGCGKTRLALQVGGELLSGYADGVWIADFAPLADPTLVPHAGASALGVPEQPGLPLTDTLIGTLRSKTILLILDNCEHLLTACGRLADTLLRRCQNLRILATSREVLGIAGELVYRVPSLSAPNPARLPSIEELTRYEAVCLFLERAAFSQPDFRITRSNAAAVAQVTHRLDGIPLAIELAAARVKALPVDVIAERLDNQFGLLTGGSRSSLPRHQTLRATLDWSYDLLQAPERILLDRLSTFSGGFTLEAADRVCPGEGLEAGDILDGLSRLVDKSLVAFEAGSGSPRYRLLEMMRQYGRERLEASGTLEMVRNRHLDFFLHLAEEAEPQLEGAQQALWLRRLEAEHDNLREALAWAIRNAPEQGLRLVGALGRLWVVRGHHTEGRVWLREALERDVGGSRALRAKALKWAGWIAVRQRDYAAGRALHEESLTIYRELGDRRGVADALAQLGNLSMNQADHEASCSFFEESLDIYRQLKDRQGVLQVLGGLGHEAWHQGDYLRARTMLEEALPLAAELGQTRLRVFVLYSLGLVAVGQHNYAEAHARYEEGLATARELGEVYHCTNLLEAFATLIAEEGQHVRAARLLGAAEAHRKATGSPLPLAHRSDYDRPVAIIRAGLTEEAFTAAWVEGGAMTLEQAMENVLMPAPPVQPTFTRRQTGPLTPRERQIAGLISHGRTNREIGSSLAIAERTVDTHVEHILNKLGFTSRTQIAAGGRARIA